MYEKRFKNVIGNTVDLVTRYTISGLCGAAGRIGNSIRTREYNGSLRHREAAGL